MDPKEQLIMLTWKSIGQSKPVLAIVAEAGLDAKTLSRYGNRLVLAGLEPS